MIIGGFATDTWGWRAAFFIVGVPGAIVALITWIVLKEPVRGRYDKARPAGGSETKADLRGVAVELWRSPVARNVIVALTLASFFGSASSGFMGAYLARRFDLGYTEIGAIIAATFMFGAAISTLGGGLLADWAGRRNQRWYLLIPAIGVALSVPLLIAAYASTTWESLAVFLFLASVAGAAFYAPSYAVLHNAMGPNARAKTTVIAQFSITLIGYSAGPLLAGLSMDLTAAHLFGDRGFSDFPTSCPGGLAPDGASPQLASACRSALFGSTQIVIICFAAMKLWPVYHFFAAARHLPNQPAGSEHV